MKRREVRYRAEARADLANIYNIILDLSRAPSVAFRFVTRIRERCSRIGDAPRSGRPRDDLLPGLRMVAFRRSVVILYRVENDRVEIANIFYGGRDYEALYRAADTNE
ncbi:MAG TPA: type II toxin-antitoxin system RelE/ParE family toxin [Xanthobacteraceae bacterium]|nr:type II toxin-antitoxin system RelE/ParE family toxin [Xanthobacteraceae bacterium]